MKTLLDFLAVGAGSFLGGALRFLVGKWLPGAAGGGFPWATFAVNVAGSPHRRRRRKSGFAPAPSFW